MLSWFKQALLPLLIAGLAGLTFQQQWLSRLDYLLYDAAQQWMPGAQVQDSVIIAIDEHSIAELGRWPWPRHRHAQLIEQLTDQHQGHIYFDVLFIDPSNTADDRRLAQAIVQHGKVFLPMSIEAVAHNQQPLELLPLPPLFAAAAGVGHVHLDCADDGVCRSFYRYLGLGQAHWPHLATLPSTVNRPSAGLPHNGDKGSALWVYHAQHHYLPFSPDDAIPILSYSDVLKGKVDIEALHNKNLFIGATTPGVHDILTTPLGRMPGVVINALLHHHWQGHTLVKQLQAPWLPWLIGAVFAIIFTLFSMLPPRAFLLSTLALVALQGALALGLLVGFRVWIPAATLLIAPLLFYPLWSWQRIELAMRHLQRQLQQRPQHPLAPMLNIAGPVLNTASARAPMLMGNDPVAKTITDVEQTTHTQYAAHELLERSIADLQEGCIVFDCDYHCQLANALVRSWLPHWNGKRVTDLDKHLTLTENYWPDALTQLMAKDTIIECEATQRHAPDITKKIVLLRAKRCTITLPQVDKPITLGLITLADISSLKRSEKQREDTLSFVSHDLRSPLVSILALIKHWRVNHLDVLPAEGLQSPDAASKSATDKLLAQVEQYANRNLSYTESLLQLNRAEQMTSETNTICDFQAICEDAMAQMKPLADQGQCPIKTAFRDQEFWVSGNYELLQRALVNLISNAIKYGATDKGIIIGLQLTGDDQVSLSVQDFGPGMTEDQLLIAFERFSRPVTLQDGVGLGLYFVKQVIERHGGKVTINATKLSPEKNPTTRETGCTVTCTLPLQQLDFLP